MVKIWQWQYPYWPEVYKNTMEYKCSLKNNLLTANGFIGLNPFLTGTGAQNGFSASIFQALPILSPVFPNASRLKPASWHVNRPYCWPCLGDAREKKFHQPGVGWIRQFRPLGTEKKSIFFRYFTFNVHFGPNIFFSSFQNCKRIVNRSLAVIFRFRSISLERLDGFRSKFV